MTASQQRVAKAALLWVPFTIIAYQLVRDDGYDPEKVGLIAIAAAIIAGSSAGDWIAWLQPLFSKHRQERVKSLFTLSTDNALNQAVLAVFLAALLATLLSLSASLSFWGEPSRAQGLLSLVLYLILFWQAMNLAQQERAALIPILLTASIPVCLWQLILARQGANRLLLGSSAGNPNFLSSWLVMVLLFSVPQLLANIAPWSRPWRVRQSLKIVFYALPIGLMALSLSIGASRGALLGLAAGWLFCCIAWIVLARRRQLLLAIGTILVIGVVVYTAIGVWVKLNAHAIPQAERDGLVRLFQPYDSVRLQVWNAASNIVYLQSEPIFNINHQGDPLALLRPLVGYGLETTEQLQSRFGDIFGPNVAVNSFHNVIFDLLTTQGWIGLLAWIGLMESALYLGLRYLSLLNTESHPLRQFATWQATGAIIGIVVLPIVVADSSLPALAPLGAAIGAVGGVLFGIAWSGWRRLAKKEQQPSEKSRMREDQSLVLAVLAVLLAQWIDNQFGFATGSTQPLLWILLGCLGGTLRSPAPDTSDDLPAASTFSPSLWYGCALIAGIFTLFCYGQLFHSQFFQLDNGSTQLPFLLGSLFLFGWLGSLLHAAQLEPFGKQFSRACAWLLVILLSWAVFLLVKTAILNTVGRALDTVMLNSAIRQSDRLNMARDLVIAVLPMAACGLIVAFVALMVMRQSIPPQGPGLQAKRSAGVVATLAACSLLVCSFYVVTYTGGVLQNIGNSLMERSTSTAIAPGNQSPQIGVAALEAASNLIPPNALLRLHWASALASTLALADSPDAQNASRAQITQLLTDIFRSQPYFVNTLEWRNFSNAFADLLK